MVWSSLDSDRIRTTILSILQVSKWVSEIPCNKLQSVAELPRVLVKVVGGNFLDVSFEVFGVDYSGRTF